MKTSGIILAIVGVLAIIAGIVAPIVGVSAGVSVVNSTDATTYGAGTLVKVLNTGKLVATPENPYDENVPITSVRVTKANQQAMSQADAKAAGATIFDTSNTTTRTDNNEQLSVSKAVFAFNPENSDLINCCGASLGDNTNIDFQGVMPLKFPFGSPQGDVNLFNADLQKPVAAKYQGTEEQYGMTLYKYSVAFPPTQTPAPPTSVPAALAQGLVGKLAPELADKVPATGNLDMYEFLTADDVYLVEPLSGQIVSGNVKEKTTFRLNGGDKDIVTKVDILAGSDPAHADAAAADVKSAADLLKMVALATPILIGLGVVLLIVGIVLIVLGVKRKKAKVAAAGAGATAGAGAGGGGDTSAS